MDAATSEASCHSPLHLNSEHPSTLRRLLSDAEASRHRDQQSVGSEDDDNTEGAGGANVPSYAGDDVFLRTSDSSGVASCSSNRCLPHYGDAECHHRMAYSNGGRAQGLYHDDVGSSQFVRRENMAVQDRDGMEMMSVHLTDGNKNLLVPNDYLPLKSEPMELNEADGLVKTDVNFNPLYASDRLGMTGGYDVGGGHPYLLDSTASVHSNHPPHLSMSVVMAEHARSQLGRELSHDAEVGTRSRLQVEGRRQLYEQPKLLFCDLVAAFKQLDDIWIRVGCRSCFQILLVVVMIVIIIMIIIISIIVAAIISSLPRIVCTTPVLQSLSPLLPASLVIFLKSFAFPHCF